MQLIPKKASLICGTGEGETELEAIDNALLEAGIGNLNLVEVSSVLPADCEISELTEIEPGTIVPVAIAKISSSNRDEKISAAIAVAKSKGSHGLISEFTGKKITKEEAKVKAKSILKNMMESRNLKIDRIDTAAVEHTVKKNGASVAAVILTS